MANSFPKSSYTYKFKRVAFKNQKNKYDIYHNILGRVKRFSIVL